MNWKRALVVAGLVVGLGVAGGCRDNFKDLESVKYRDPDKVEGYNNVDRNPNLTRLCIDGVAFMTTTRDYDSVLRVPEWDSWCKK